MKIIVGLGNPTDRYAGTRHNMGFGVADELAERHQIRMSPGRHRALCGTGVIEGEKVLLVKPLTYMNASGESVRPIVDYYKAEVGDVIIVYDDISLDVGQIRVRGKGSAGGHNGMKSVIAHLGSSDFPRVRVGVGAKPPQMDLADYVLSHFPKEELPTVRESLRTAADAVEMILSDGVERTMNRYNAYTRKLSEVKPSGED
ncbi:MAG: aminoacyl-tRNA hydrolase [Lachnospiraceae bacterium]|nr:aminoacyl-tRNA hydrolase [Lachnospiraceae bacterium]